MPYEMIEKLDVNLTKLARETGYTLSHMSRVFTGTRRVSISCAKAISRALHISIDQLVELLETGTVKVWRESNGESESD